LGVGLTTLHHKNKLVMKNLTEPQIWTDSMDKRSKLWNMGIRFGMWNVRSLYRAGSLMTVSRELARYKLDLAGVQEVRWEGGVGQNRDLKLTKRSFENVSQFNYLGTIVINQNLIQEEIKRRLNAGNACFHSFQNLLSSYLLSKNLKIMIKLN
jgi:hypothetical protein